MRIIAATTADLRRQVQAGRLREDRYYRLPLLFVRLPRLVKKLESVLKTTGYNLNKTSPSSCISLPEALILNLDVSRTD